MQQRRQAGEALAAYRGCLFYIKEVKSNIELAPLLLFHQYRGWTMNFIPPLTPLARKTRFYWFFSAQNLEMMITEMRSGNYKCIFLV
jgi:hypothetical protein